MNGKQMLALVKTAFFLVVFPGFVLIYVPLRMIAPEPRADLGAARYFALVLWIIGGATVIWCGREFAMRGLGTPAPFDPPQSLVISGLYRYVRNPMYLGAIAIVLGIALWIGSRSVLLYAMALWITFHLFVLVYEEPHLQRKFGDSYTRYRHQVRRWLPRFRAYSS